MDNGFSYRTKLDLLARMDDHLEAIGRLLAELSENERLGADYTELSAVIGLRRDAVALRLQVGCMHDAVEPLAAAEAKKSA